jgi:hypothetical protein
MVTQRSDKDLGLMFQTAKGLAVNDAVTVSLKRGTHGTRLFRPQPPLRQPGLHSIGGKLLFLLFEPKADV